jgi:hypothetical protein
MIRPTLSHALSAEATRSHLLRRLLACSLLLLLALVGGARTARAQTDEKMFVLPAATEGVTYNQPVTPPAGTPGRGVEPYIWTPVEGNFPSPLTLTSDGRLTGMPPPSSPTPYRFRVTVRDSSAPQRMATRWLSLTVNPAPLIAPPGATEVPTPPPHVVVGPGAPPFVLTTSTADEETIALTQEFNDPAPASPIPGADTSDANITNLKAMIAASIGTSTTNFKDGDYCVVHVIVWKPLNAEGKSDPDRELWALFRSRQTDAGTVEWLPQADPKNKDAFATRIFGQKRVAVLLVHMNTPRAWDVGYKVSITQTIPTPLQHLLDLASNIFKAGGGPEAATKNIWGARMMLVKYESSEIVVKVNTVNSGGKPVELGKEYTNKFVNEGRYHWDVSVGLPVQSVRELQFNSDGNRVTATAKEKQSVYGFLNLYPKAVDLKDADNKFFTFPHFVLGVPLASKPLHRPFVGVGTGVYKMPIKFNIFAGVVFIRERVPRTLSEGQAATTTQLEADLHTRWVRKFMFGINLPVSQIKDAIKK